MKDRLTSNLTWSSSRWRGSRRHAGSDGPAVVLNRSQAVHPSKMGPGIRINSVCSGSSTDEMQIVQANRRTSSLTRPCMDVAYCAYRRRSRISARVAANISATFSSRLMVAVGIDLARQSTWIGLSSKRSGQSSVSNPSRSPLRLPMHALAPCLALLRRPTSCRLLICIGMGTLASRSCCHVRHLVFVSRFVLIWEERKRRSACFFFGPRTLVSSGVERGGP